MFMSGLIPEPMSAYEDFRLLEYGIGFTNIVARTTRGSADLTKKEIREGKSNILFRLLLFKQMRFSWFQTICLIVEGKFCICCYCSCCGIQVKAVLCFCLTIFAMHGVQCKIMRSTVSTSQNPIVKLLYCNCTCTMFIILYIDSVLKLNTA